MDSKSLPLVKSGRRNNHANPFPSPTETSDPSTTSLEGGRKDPSPRRKPLESRSTRVLGLCPDGISFLYKVRKQSRRLRTFVPGTDRVPQCGPFDPREASTKGSMGHSWVVSVRLGHDDSQGVSEIMFEGEHSLGV